MFQHIDWAYRGNKTGVRGKNKNKLQRKAETKSREKEYDVDSHRDPFLRHICIPELGFLEDNIRTLYLYNNLPPFFFVQLSRLGLCNFKSLLYKLMELNIFKIFDAHCFWCPLLSHLKETGTTFPINYFLLWFPVRIWEKYTHDLASRDMIAIFLHNGGWTMSGSGVVGTYPGLLT